MKTNTFRIHGTDVVLYDYEPGKGKVILSNDDFDYNLSHYWGAMGDGYDLSRFLQRCSVDYLIGKLGERTDQGEIDLKRTMASVRKFIREETSWRWYYSPEADKLLRDELNEIQEYSYDHNDFVRRMCELEIFYEGNIYWESEFKDMISQISSEPWHFIIRHKPPVNVWLGKFLIQLKAYLKGGQP